MKNSETRDEFHDRNRAQRLEQIRDWAEYVRTHPDEDWGKQVNTVVNSQLQSARFFEDSRPDPDELQESPLFED